MLMSEKVRIFNTVSDFDKILEQMDQVHLSWLNGFSIESALYFDCFNIKQMAYDFKGLVWGYISEACLYKYVRKGTGCIAFVIPWHESRNEAYRELIRKVYSTVPPKNRLYIENVKGKHLDPKIFSFPIMYLIWAFQTRKIKMEKFQRIFLLSRLHMAWMSYRNIEHLMKDCKINLCTVFCDVVPPEAFLVQSLNKKGIPTATLQHGHFGAKERPWVFKLSRSRYFLAQGKYARKQAMLCDIDESGVIPLGMMNMIGVPQLPVKLDNGNFGLLLNGPGAKDDNIPMIQAANSFAKRHNLKYSVRCHPSIPIENFKNVIDKDSFLGECKKGTSMSEYISTVAFALVGNSTVFIDVMNQGKLAMRFCGPSIDIFDGIKWCKFTSVDELDMKLGRLLEDRQGTEKKILDTRAELCCEGDVADNYRQFFKKLYD